MLYQVARAEYSSLPDHCVDLVTVAQAFHWFNFNSFFKEVRRVAKPGGVLAIWTYNQAHVNIEIDAIIQGFNHNFLMDDWDPERHYVETGYATVVFPFPSIPSPQFHMRTEWTVEHFLGYLETWSAIKNHIKRNGNKSREIDLIR